jgi:hypothetical protein
MALSATVEMARVWVQRGQAARAAVAIGLVRSRHAEQVEVAQGVESVLDTLKGQMEQTELDEQMVRGEALELTQDLLDRLSDGSFDSPH